MRIGIDARMYGSAHTGIGVYIKNLITQLEKFDSDNEYVIFLHSQNYDEYQPKNPKFIKVLADYRWYTISEQLNMPGLINDAKVDLMHFCHFNVPVRYKGPYIVSIHDLQLFYFSRDKVTTLPPWKYKIKLMGFKFIIKQAIKRARQVITFAEYTKQDIMQKFDIAADKIDVIYHGFGEQDIESKINLENGSFNKKLRDKGVNKPYLLYVGTSYPHKNLKRLVEAFKIYNEIYGDDYQLVIAGKIDYFAEQLIKYAQEIGISGIEKAVQKVVFWGFVDNEDLPFLYKNAKLYVFPSLMEGFGLPPLEAMKFDVPVVSAQSSCLPEILGNAAYYFDPYDCKDMAHAINKGLTDNVLQDRLKSAAKILLPRYTWFKAAKATLNLYKKSV